MWDVVVGVLSLNNDIIASLGLIRTPFIKKSTIDLNKHNSVRMHPYARGCIDKKNQKNYQK
jgi:hypothetical protein